ncbi:MAG: ABC-type transport system, involved in lipoprotein release, ATPase component [uncultured bacterium]|nr:MAG: ABC-type transport system, involved in lipoprotein release, ATPase component [uncultured bacterium]
MKKSTKVIIRVDKITKIYQVGDVQTMALDSISFEINRGEYVAIMGPSGSGKSTLMHILGALDKPTKGSYILDGTRVEKMSSDQLAEIRNKQIGFIFQAYNLLPRTSALKNVILPMRYGGIPAEKRAEIARKYLELVGLSDRINNLTNQLSGGQQQRVAIARALTMNPSILLADEPTGNIATAQAEEVMKIFDQLNREGHTIVMITHEPDIAQHAKRIITIRDGKKISDKIMTKYD